MLRQADRAEMAVCGYTLTPFTILRLMAELAAC
jgi:hypothetical protein